MESVSIIKCEEYEYDKVEKAIFKALDDINGLKEKIGSGKKVLVKPNLLKRNFPEDGVTTHPFVVEAVVRYLQQFNCKVIVGDSPGGPFNTTYLNSVYKATGMLEVSRKTGCELILDTSSVEIKSEDATRLKNMQIIKTVTQVDFVVSVAKLKTHGMMTFTGAVKNLFGVIAGLKKIDYHFKLQNTENFANHILDICEYVKPLFSIMDAIEGMEGNGPSSGDKRQVGLILASLSPYALDTVAVNIAGIDTNLVPTIKVAGERGIFSGELKDIEFTNISLNDIKIQPFKLPDSVKGVNFLGNKAPGFLKDWINNSFRSKPVIIYQTCISCGDCVRSCPAKTIEIIEKKPVIKLDKCIRCFCCHELCPKRSIEIKKHWLYKLIG